MYKNLYVSSGNAAPANMKYSGKLSAYVQYEY